MKNLMNLTTDQQTEECQLVRLAVSTNYKCTQHFIGQVQKER